MRAAIFLLALLFVVSPARAGEPLSPGFENLLGTRLAEVELGKAGGETVSRKYDEHGALKELVYRNFSKRPPLVEKLEISHSPELWTRSSYHGSVLVRRTTEHYSGVGVLARSESVWSSNDTEKLDRKTVIRYLDLEAHITEFSQVSGSWQLVSDSTESAIEGKSQQTEAYTACLDAAHRITDVDRCGQMLDALPVSESNLQSFDAAEITNLTCEKDHQLFLPNGFRIDLATCSTPAARDLIRRVTDGSFGKQLACLDKINHGLAVKMAETVVARRPLVKCAGTSGRVGNQEFCSKPDDAGSACVRKIESMRQTTAAFFEPSHPENLYLAQADPMGTAPVNEGELATTLFHESLHSCAHHHHGGKDTLKGGLHDAVPPSYGDAVYGCEALCGANPEFITREGCRACATAEQNKAAPGLLDSCAKFPSAASVRQLEEARWINANIQKCESSPPGKKAMACAALGALTLLPEVCGHMPVTDAACLSALKIAGAKRLLAVARNKTEAAAFAAKPKYTVTAQGLTVTFDPAAGSSQSDDFANIIVEGFCERIHQKSADFTVALSTLTAITAEFNAGVFPGAPTQVRLDPRTGSKLHYPVSEMSGEAAAFSKAHGIDPRQSLVRAESCIKKSKADQSH